MNTIYEDYLFNKNILVGRESKKEVYTNIAFILAEKFGIYIKTGMELLKLNAVKVCERRLDIKMPEAFYRSFPQSVRELSVKKRAYDTYINYFITYGLGDFSALQHSYYEKTVKKIVFNEEHEMKGFTVVSKADAEVMIQKFYNDLLKSTRPLNLAQLSFVNLCVKDYGFDGVCSSRNTKLNILASSKNINYSKYISLSDIPSLVEIIGKSPKYNNRYSYKSIKKIKLKTADRKFVSKVIDLIFEQGNVDERNCYEKQAIWCGILHQIHYKPLNKRAKGFVVGIRSGKNISVYSEFEKYINESPEVAARILCRNKGVSALLRNLDYILSRCKSDEEIDKVLSLISTRNCIILLQLILKYSTKREAERTFVFSKNNLTITYYEDKEKAANCKTILSDEIRLRILEQLQANLSNILKNKLGKVYISGEMKNIALPISENTSMSGYNVLPKGSIIKLPNEKIIRFFTYWEKVNDIDLSCSGLTSDGEYIEFSWRTMNRKKGKSILYSGDQTSGYNGGSEFFDIDLEQIKQEYPTLKYIIVNNNVYSGIKFSNCCCLAGFMFREKLGSGEVYEPKTVKTSFSINSDSTFSHLFAIDIENRKVIWLNLSRKSMESIAGESNFDYLKKYFKVTDLINYFDFFSACATEIVETPEFADVVVTDEDYLQKDNQTLIRNIDIEKVTAYMNGSFEYKKTASKNRNGLVVRKQ